MMTSSFSPRANRRSRSDVVAPSPRGERRGWQIGPRIRVGGSVGKIGQNVKNAVTKGATDAGHAIGKVADNKYAQMAAMAALAATGVGAAPAAAMMAAMAGGGALLKPGGNIGDGIKGGVKGAAEGFGAAKAGQLVRGGIGAMKTMSAAKGVSSAMGADGSYTPGGADAAMHTDGGSSWLDKAKGVFSGGGLDGHGDRGLAGDLYGKLGGNDSNKGDMAKKALLAAMIADAAQQRNEQRHLQNEGLNIARDEYAAKAPIRARSLSLLQSQQTPDLGFMTNPANPYARQATPFNVSAKTPILPSSGSY